MTTTTVDRFESAEDVRAAHSALLETRPEHATAQDLDRLNEFIKRAAATGTILDAPEDRKQVQGLIDYWAASLLTECREAVRDKAPVRPKPANMILAQFASDAVNSIAAAADRWLESASEDERRLALRLLLRLLQMSSDADSFNPIPVQRSSLWAEGPPNKVDAVLDALVDAGAIRKTPGDQKPTDRFELKYEALTRVWVGLRSLLDERRKFREAVRYWTRTKQDSAALITGALLDRVLSYRDLNDLEREFIEQSRRHEGRENYRNRILKWVFGVLALVALIGWIAAGISIRHAKNETSVAKTAAENEASANKDLQKEKQTLKKKQQLTEIRLFVRVLGELASAYTRPEREIALTRWKELIQHFEPDSPVNALKLDELQRCAICADESELLSAQDLEKLYRLRNPFLQNEALSPSLEAMRAVSFAMVKLSANSTVSGLKAGGSYGDIEAFGSEFWTQYWGEMLLVEGRQVASAMVAFGEVLADIRVEAEKSADAKLIDAHVESVAKAYSPEKRKQLAQKAANLRLNATAFTNLDKDAETLDIKPGDRSRLQQGLSQIRNVTLSNHVTQTKLVTKLDERRQLLLHAMDAELSHPIPPFPFTQPTE